jgi:hypothetical protein
MLVESIGGYTKQQKEIQRQRDHHYKVTEKHKRRRRGGTHRS